ncbi:MAG: DPP IV N-terminal domain-containing protein [Ardenticatenaceae bacterium]|nr:DPP IV N-terminal domain-containing protein [Ardenticatenaceae bacterium]MCB9446091.1 DPP IV N-terminal domain-containing protein [Ardenticatenaceae bacterium]
MKQILSALFILLFLAACVQESPDYGVMVAVATPTPTMTQTVTAVPSPTPIAQTPTPRPTRTPRPTPTPYPTELPTATQPPPLDVAGLVQQLAFESVEGVNGRALSQLHVSEYGLRHQSYCEYGPYRWLDDNHLMLFPITSYTDHYGISTMGQVTQPIVVSLDGATPWITDILPTDRCDLSLWSDSLQRVIEASDSRVRLRDLQGSVTNTFEGQMPLFLAPSGRRLLAQLTWIDLETGESVILERDGRLKFMRPAWTTDERRFFECCFDYGDATTGEYWRREYGLTDFYVSGVGVGPEFIGTESFWVADETRVIVPPAAVDFRREGLQRSILPLIDPITLTYEDILERLDLPDTIVNCFPHIAPDGNRFWLDCAEMINNRVAPYYPLSYLVTLPSFDTITTTGSIDFRGWSADSRFLAYVELTDPESYTGTTWLMDTSGNRQLIADEAAQLADWHGVESLVALRFSDKQRVQFVQAETRASRVVVLDAPVVGVAWQPEDDGVVLWDENGRIWWLPNPFDPSSEPEPLTPPLPDVHSVRWSPDGNRLAFVSETNLYVVSLDRNR